MASWIDIRPVVKREQFGEIPGALIIERNVLEWRLDPASPDRHPAVSGDDQRVVGVVCQEGYASSLAAASLQELGLAWATDMVGGFGGMAGCRAPVHRRRAVGTPTTHHRPLAGSGAAPVDPSCGGPPEPTVRRIP